MTVALGLDLSLTSSGVAFVGDTDGARIQPLQFGYCGDTGHDGATWAERNRRIADQSWKVLRLIDAGPAPDLVVVEGPSYGSQYGDAWDRGALMHSVLSELLYRKLPVAVIAPKSLKLWATGSGNAEKKDVLRAVRNWWPRRHVANHDVADAAVCAATAALRLGCLMPFTTKPRHHKGLRTIAWPNGWEIAA